MFISLYQKQFDFEPECHLETKEACFHKTSDLQGSKKIRANVLSRLNTNLYKDSEFRSAVSFMDGANVATPLIANTHTPVETDLAT